MPATHTGHLATTHSWGGLHNIHLNYNFTVFAYVTQTFRVLHSPTQVEHLRMIYSWVQCAISQLYILKHGGTLMVKVPHDSNTTFLYKVNILTLFYQKKNQLPCCYPDLKKPQTVFSSGIWNSSIPYNIMMLWNEDYPSSPDYFKILVINSLWLHPFRKLLPQTQMCKPPPPILLAYKVEW